MCDGLPVPGSVSGALAMLDRALDYLNTADLAALPVDTQARRCGRWPAGLAVRRRGPGRGL